MTCPNVGAATAVAASEAADPRHLAVVAVIWTVGAVSRQVLGLLVRRCHEREHTVRVVTALQGTASRHRAAVVTACAALEAASPRPQGSESTGRRGGGPGADPVRKRSKSGRRKAVGAVRTMRPDQLRDTGTQR